jgi:chemotaxis protein methyltransferase CheR
LRIWCAAAATGQEPYSLAMIIDEMAQFAGWEIQILATDVSIDAIERAKTGLFSEAEVQRGLSLRMLSKYFRKEIAGWRIADELRNRVELRVFNLMDCFAGLGMFDVIFCRNVLMYLDAAAKSDILERLGGSLEADGYLVLGAAETTLGACNSLTVLPNSGGITMKGRRTQDLRSAGMRK